MAQTEFSPGLTRSPFQAAWWLRNPHLQTLYPAMFRSQPALRRVREKLTLNDGDWLHLDWRLPKRWTESGLPLAVLVHGLSGSSDSQYIVGLQRALEQLGWASVAMNCRGATGPNHRLQAYHAGAYADLAEVMQTVQERYPDSPLALVGFSLGGAISLNYLAHEQQPQRLFAAVTVSVPLDLAACSARLDQGFSRVYRKHLLKELTHYWQAKQAHLAAVGDPESSERLAHLLAQGPFTRFIDYDRDLIAPIHGFDSAEHYYATCSPRPKLKAISTPTLIIQANDDPFLAPECFPVLADLSPQVYLDMSPQGGHVGFVTGNHWREPVYYLEQRIPEFLLSMLPHEVRMRQLAQRLPPAYQSTLLKSAP